MPKTTHQAKVKKFIPTSEPVLDGNEKKYVLDTLERNWISAGGKYSQLLEEKFAKWVGAKFAVTCSSGTSALHLALLSLGIGRSDEVIIPDFTIICSASTTLLTGAKPVLVDVDKYWCMDPKKIEEKISKKTRAIMPIHMYGNPANMKDILRIAKKYKLFVIEDACAAHGATVNGRKVGTLGDVGCFSFYASKNMTSGEGGIVVTNSEEVANLARIFRSQGFEKPRFIHRYIGYNYRLTDIQAAIAYAQLEKIDKKVARRREIAKNYIRLLKNVSEVSVHPEPPWGKSTFWMFGVLIKESFGRSRDEVIELLAERGIGSDRFFTAMSLQPVFLNDKSPNYPDVSGNYSVSRDVGARGLYLPTGLNITLDQQKKVVEILLSLRVKGAKIIKPTFVRKDKRGTFIEALNDIGWENVSYGSMKKGAVMGNHYHKETLLFFYITKGAAKIDIINVKSKVVESFILKAHQGVIFKPNHSHAIRFLELSNFVMGKSLKYDPINPDTYPFTVPEVK